jgi:stringent starvation protein B
MDSSHLSQSLFIQRRCLLEYTFQSLIDELFGDLQISGLAPEEVENVFVVGDCAVNVLVDFFVDGLTFLFRNLKVNERVDLPNGIVGIDVDFSEIESLVEPVVPVVFVFVVYHSETALGIVVENDAADDLVGALNDADAQVAFFEKTEQIRVVVQLIQSFPDFFRLIVDQRLQFLYVIQF